MKRIDPITQAETAEQFGRHALHHWGDLPDPHPLKEPMRRIKDRWYAIGRAWRPLAKR